MGDGELPARGRRGLLIIAVLGALGVLAFSGLQINFVAEDSIMMDRLFTNARAIGEPDRAIDGVVVSAGECALEPSYLSFRVRQKDGGIVDLVANRSARIIWPGTTEETAAAGNCGEVDPPGISMADFEGLRITGTYRTGRVGQWWHSRSQAFLVRGALRN